MSYYPDKKDQDDISLYKKAFFFLAPNQPKAE